MSNKKQHLAVKELKDGRLRVMMSRDTAEAILDLLEITMNLDQVQDGLIYDKRQLLWRLNRELSEVLS